MKAKTFIENLSECIFEEYKEEIPQKDLKSSFLQAIKNVSAGKLRDELNENFEKNLKRLEKSLKNLCTRELPSISSSHVDDSLEELTKSEVGGRTEVTEGTDTSKQIDKMIYSLLESDDLKKPKPGTMKTLEKKQRYLLYRTFLHKVLNRNDASDTFILSVLQDFDKLCKISQQENDGKSKFDWLPMCSLLLQLVTGSKPVAYVRVLKILFDSIGNDVNNCISKNKPVRSGKLAGILKRFITSIHLHVDKQSFQISEERMYCRYVSAILSFYVDLSCVYSSKIEQKKLYGREIAGYVCFILQKWPESLLEVVLQLQGLEEDNHVNVLLPLMSKCLEVKPSFTDNVYYLKYVLLVRQVKDTYGEYEQVQQWNYATKNIPAGTGFINWLKENCEEALEHIPVEDKKFKKTKITRFLLEEAEDDLIAILLNTLCSDDAEDEHDVVDSKEDDVKNRVDMPAGPLFYLDKTGGGSNVVELVDSQAEEKLKSKDLSKQTIEKGSKKRTKHKPIVLKTVEDIEKIVDTDIEQVGMNSPQTYTLDPEFVRDKVVDPEDQKFLQSEIISITSVDSEMKKKQTIEVDDSTMTGNESQISNISDKSEKWGESSSSTPNKRKRNKKNAKKMESDYSDISAIEKSEDFCDSISSLSEDNHIVKSVVRKVTPKKVQEKYSKCTDMDSLADITVKYSSDSKADIGSPVEISDVNVKGNVNGFEIELEASKEQYEVSSDTYTENKNDTVNSDALSPVHESSVEIVDIVLAPKDQTDILAEQETSQGRLGDRGRDSAFIEGSPGKMQKSRSSRIKLSDSSPVSIKSDKTKDIVSSESSLSCLSGLSTATNFSETIDISTTDVSESEQNTTQEVLDSTAVFIEGQIEGSPLKTPSGSESDSGKRTRKGSRKSMSTEREGISPKKSLSEVKAGNESDGDVFRKTTNSQKDAKIVKSIEEKFIGKAIKGKKTPKNSKSDKNKVQEVSGSVSLFSEIDDDDSQVMGGGDSGKRTKSTEEIIQIVEDIKSKIKTPQTRKSLSKCGEKLNESMFTDDSVESVEKEENLVNEEQKSKGKEQEEKLGSEGEDVCQKEIKANLSNSENRNKSNNDDIVIIESSDENEESVPVRRENSLKSEISSCRNEISETKSEENLNEYNNASSPLRNKSIRTPQKSDFEDTDLKSEGIPLESVKESSKSPQESSEGKRNKISVSETPDKNSVSPNKSLTRSTDKRKKSSGKSQPMLNEEVDFKETVSNSEDESETIILTKTTPRRKASEEGSELKDKKTPSSVKKNIKTPQSNKKSVKDDINDMKSPKEKLREFKSPSLSPRTSLEMKESSYEIKSPDADEMTILTNNVDSKNTEGNSEDESETIILTDSSPKVKVDQRKSPNIKQKKSTPSAKKSMKIPQSKKDISEEVSNIKSPNGKNIRIMSPKTAEGTSLLQSPASDRKKKSTPQKSETKSRTTPPTTGQLIGEKSNDSADDFVPSSQKKSRRKSVIKGAQKKDKATLPLSSSDSDEDIDFLPDIGSHLKVSSPSAKHDDSKSPHIFSKQDNKASEKKVNEKTPLKGRRHSHGAITSPNGESVDNPSDTTQKKGTKAGKVFEQALVTEKESDLDGPIEVDTDTTRDKRVTRARRVSEQVIDTEESDVNGPTRPKRLRASSKAESDTPDTPSTKARATRSKAELKRIYDYHSGTDCTTDQSDIEIKPTRRSRGSARLTAIKDKIPEAVDEEPVAELKTPLGKSQRQRTGSASTTKKSVIKQTEVRGTRKRRLSGELAGKASPGGNTTDSDIAFPKTKTVAVAEKKSKRLSAPVSQANDESKPDPSGRRYSLRKK